MREISSKPRVFVSSTIRDFRDLRSALKFWLEEMGVEVRMSEFNDFAHRPDQGTFESCFSAIRDCDYYILLIGGRRGQPFFENESSVTRQEYLTAASLWERDEIGLLVFVRGEVRTAVQERRALRAKGVDASELASFPSRVLEDPDFVETFIGEIENRQLPSERGEPVGATWIYPFDTFEDVVTALRMNLRLHRSMQRQALLANLKWEVEENIAVLVHKHLDGLPFPHSWWLGHLRRKTRLTDEVVDGRVRLARKDAQRVLAFRISLPEADRLRTMALREAVLSGEFLEYDRGLGTLGPGPAYTGMQRLLAAIDSYRGLHSIVRSSAEEWDRLSYAVRRRQDPIDFSGYRLALLFRTHDIMDDILRLCVALERYIADPTAQLQLPPANPPTPLQTEVAAIEAERPTHEDVERWSADAQFWGWLDPGASMTAADVAAFMERYPAARDLLEHDAEQLAQELTERVRRDGLAAALVWLASCQGPNQDATPTKPDDADRGTADG